MLPSTVAYLACHHRVRFSTSHPPEEGTSIWCERCADMQTVRVLVGPWRARCMHCHNLNAHSMEHDPIMEAAEIHRDTYKHSVWIWCVGNTETPPTLLRSDAAGSSVVNSGTCR